MDRIPPRYEHKFALTPARAAAVRAAIAPWCALDEHAGPDDQYAITTLYLDTADFTFHRMREVSARRRFKLRVRRYGDDDAGPVLLEVKEKIGDVVVKRRAAIPREGWVERLQGLPPDDAGAAEHDFRARMQRFGARPVVLCRYEREAYKSVVDAYARVTFDRRLAYQPCDRFTLAPDPDLWETADDPAAFDEPRASRVVLELKFGRDLPRWMVDLVRRFDLERVGFSKYSTGVGRLLGRRAVLPADGRTARF